VPKLSPIAAAFDTARSCWRRWRIGFVLYAVIFVVCIAWLIAVPMVCATEVPRRRMAFNSGYNGGACCRGVQCSFIRANGFMWWPFVLPLSSVDGAALWAYAIATCLPFFRF
jgi:hypothetical protein